MLELEVQRDKQEEEKMRWKGTKGGVEGADGPAGEGESTEVGELREALEKRREAIVEENKQLKLRIVGLESEVRKGAFRCVCLESRVRELLVTIDAFEEVRTTLEKRHKMKVFV